MDNSFLSSLEKHCGARFQLPWRDVCCRSDTVSVKVRYFFLAVAKVLLLVFSFHDESWCGSL